MAYPMTQMPTFAEFRDRLVGEFQCTFEVLPDSLIINDGEPQAVHYLKRIVNDTTRTYTVVIGEEQRVMPSLIRSACGRLEVDPTAFGLTLG